MSKFVAHNPGATNDTTERTLIEPAWPGGGIVSRNVADRQYDVQQFTGMSYGTVPGTNWNRGALFRYGAPTFKPAPPIPMYDPSKTDRTFN